MLTNETIRKIHENAVAHGFHEPDSEPTFGEYCALIHEEISEAFSAWRKGEPDEYVKDSKPEGVWVELADVVIRCADYMGQWDMGLTNFHRAHCVGAYTFGEFINLLHVNVSEWYRLERIELTAVRISDLIDKIYVYSRMNHIDLDAIIERKHAYNVTRPYKHGKRM